MGHYSGLTGCRTNAIGRPELTAKPGQADDSYLALLGGVVG
jgi:hypothetical protein